MNKTVVMVVAVFALIAGFAANAASAAASDSERPTLHVVTDTSFPPLEFRNPKTGKYEGFDIDMLRAVAKHAGFDYNLTSMNFAGMIPALQAHSVDIAVAGIFITKAREKAIDFSVPYASSGMRIMVRSDNDSIHKLSDLDGKKVSTKIGSTDLKFLNEKVPGAEVIPVSSTSSMYLMLTTGNADAAFYDIPNMEYYVAHKGKESVRLVGPVYKPVKTGFAFPKGSKWVEPVNKAIKEIKADGTYARIHQKWFGSTAGTSEEINGK